MPMRVTPSGVAGSGPMRGRRPGRHAGGRAGLGLARLPRRLSAVPHAAHAWTWTRGGRPATTTAGGLAASGAATFAAADETEGTTELAGEPGPVAVFRFATLEHPEDGGL